MCVCVSFPSNWKIRYTGIRNTSSVLSDLAHMYHTWVIQ